MNRYLSKLFVLLTFLLFTTYAHANQSCVDQRIADFRAHAGPDAPIRFDVLEEWEEECSTGSESALFSSPDIEITISSNPYYGTLMFKIQAIEDSVVVRNVVINRGNCILAEGTAAEINRDVFLFFGEFYQGYSNNCGVDNVREIQITTGIGGFTFTF